MERDGIPRCRIHDGRHKGVRHLQYSFDRTLTSIGLLAAIMMASSGRSRHRFSIGLWCPSELVFKSQMIRDIRLVIRERTRAMVALESVSFDWEYMFTDPG